MPGAGSRNVPDMSFRPEQLLPLLQPLGARRMVVAFSGGCDSTALLHALARLGPRLGAELLAAHIDHGLHPDSARWAVRCAAFCQALGVPCHTIRVTVGAAKGESPEAAAREARYAALATLIEAGDLLLTAHHRDDQAETLLLRLLRGAGPRGLAAMPFQAPFGRGLLVRPLLGLPRAALCGYARDAGLAWIDDPSNFDTDFDRNFLRHEILPTLAGRWPALSSLLARAARHQAEAAGLLDELAADDLSDARGTPANTLLIGRLSLLSAARQRNLLRYFLRRCGVPVPDAVHLERIRTELIPARADAMPLVAWPGGEARRYRDRIFALRPLPAVPPTPLPWDLSAPLPLPPGLGTLVPLPARGAGVAIPRESAEIRFGPEGERCRVAGHRHTSTLKNLFQAAAIPPWERARTPLLYIGNRLAAVGDRWICEPFAASRDEMGIALRWERFSVETGGENKDNLRGLAP